MNRGSILNIAISILAILSLGVYGASILEQANYGQDGRGGEAVDTRPEATGCGDLSGNVLTVSKYSQQKSGIVTRRLAPFIYRRSITGYGEVLSLQDLLQLRNSYLTAAAQAHKSVLRLDLSRNDYARAKALFKSTKYVSLEKLQTAEAAFYSDLADSEAAFQNLSGLKGEILQEWGNVIAKWMTENSPAAKALIARKFSIILVTLSPDTRMTKAPSSAEIETIGGKKLEATLISMSPVSNPAIQGASYFYRVPTSPSLSVGMNVVAHLSVGRNTAGVVVPDSAVVWQNGNAWVYLKTGNDRFLRKRLATADRTHGGWFVNKSIEPGESLVIAGAQLLLSQEFKAHIRGDDD